MRRERPAQHQLARYHLHYSLGEFLDAALYSLFTIEPSRKGVGLPHMLPFLPDGVSGTEIGLASRCVQQRAALSTSRLEYVAISTADMNETGLLRPPVEAAGTFASAFLWLS